MKLKRDRRTIFSNISRIFQSLGPDCLLALSAVSRLLGQEFYRLRPNTLLLCLPIYLVTILGRIKWYAIRDQEVDYIYTRIPIKQGKSKQGRFLKFEKYIYLLIYLITDIISCFELSTILALSIFHFNIIYVYTALFPLSIFYALFVHTQYRLPEYNHNYHKIEQIMWDQEVTAPISTGIASISTFFCIIASMAVFEASPAIAVALCLLGALCFYRFLNENKYSLYGIYLFDFALTKLFDFHRLVTEHLKLFNITAPLPILATCSYLCVNSLALLYSVAYFYSTERNRYIHQRYNELLKPDTHHDPHPIQAHP